MAHTRRLPRPVTEVWDWQLHGACRGMSSELFFAPDGERGLARARRDAVAKAICALCPVLDRCRQHALGARESHGVWGGLTEHERITIRQHGRLSLARTPAGP